MNPDLVVRVEVIFSNDSKAIGTGYPIANGRILTARHVVSASNGNAKSVEVVWCKLGSDGHRPHAKAAIVWVPSEQEVDLALLSCDFPIEVRGPFGAISSRSPRSHEPWESHGFASAEADGGNRPLVALKGTCFQPSGSGDFYFDLDVDATTSMEKGWRGVSGAPVFVGGMIKGVIVECPGNYSNDRLRAMRVGNLCIDQNFCEIAGFSNINEYKKFAERKLVKLFENSRSLSIELANYLDIDLNIKNAFYHISKEIMGKSTEEILEIFEYICTSWDKKEWPSDISAQSVCEIVFIIIPVSVENGVIQSLNAQDIVSWRADPVQIHTEHMAEIAMASYDGRAVQVDTGLGSGAEVFRATHAIPAPPTEGLDSAVDTMLANVTKHLIDEYAKSVESNTETRVKIANKRLAQLSKFSKSKYITFLSEISKEDSNVVDFMSQLKQKFDNLFVIPRSADEDVILNEGTIPSSIEYFLKLAARTK